MAWKRSAPPRVGDPFTVDVPDGDVRCLRCSWPFTPVDRTRNRICPSCTVRTANLSRREECELNGGNRVHPWW
jgi:Zn finger protein HypA/HybF involved in hydrogenase expression